MTSRRTGSPVDRAARTFSPVASGATMSHVSANARVIRSSARGSRLSAAGTGSPNAA